MGPQALAQTPPRLGPQLYAGLSITGAVGSVYQIQYVTDLAQTNDWRCLTFLQLPTTNYLWTDTSTPATGRRFYRAVATAPSFRMTARAVVPRYTSISCAISAGRALSM